MIYLISYPRSGNHWTRFICEWFSGRPTLGCPGNQADSPIYRRLSTETVLRHVNPTSPPFSTKLHRFPSCLQSDDIPVLILRNFKECVIRHVGGRSINQINPSQVEHLANQIGNYLQIVQSFANWPGKKYFLYYEDIIQIPEIVLPPFLQHFEIWDEDKWNQFKARQSEFAQLCVQMYDLKERSLTRGRNMSFHQSRFQNEEFWKVIETQIRATPEILPYLERYL